MPGWRPSVHGFSGSGSPIRHASGARDRGAHRGAQRHASGRIASRRDPAGRQGGHEHRGQLFDIRFLDRRRITFCPACLLEDRQMAAGSHGQRVGRLHWMFAPVRTCPRHGIPLIRRKAATEEERFQLPGALAESDDALERLAAETPRHGVSPLQAYVAARIDGQAGPQWLDSQRIDQVARATQLLGACLFHGTLVKASLLTQERWDESGKVGFGFISRGPDGVRDGLEEIFSAVKRQQPVSTPRSAYGPLYSGALSDPDGIGRPRTSCGAISLTACRSPPEKPCSAKWQPSGGAIASPRSAMKRVFHEVR
ncbi:MULTISPECIES: TniQ family protein [Paracoccus]|nr:MULTISPECIES: TniQ family protein [Paracoccus]